MPDNVPHYTNLCLAYHNTFTKVQSGLHSPPRTPHIYPLPCTNAPFVAAAAAAAAVPAAPSIGMVAGHSNYSFRNTRLFDRNPTTWVPQAPMRNGE